MNKYLEQAMDLKSNMLKDRRHIHKNPECGMNLPNTKAYVIKRLQEIGLKPKSIGDSGVEVTIKGKEDGKTILLRCDMDALPMEEINELPFKSENSFAHTCGHDFHTSIMLTVAQILKENVQDIKGNVKLVFQPGEEVGQGARMLIEEGILENPKVDAAMAMHVAVDIGVGESSYAIGGAAASSNCIEIKVTGKGCHGGMPHLGIDPIMPAIHIYQSCQNLLAREVSSSNRVTLTFGAFNAGTTANIIPQEAKLLGTLRTYNIELRDKLVNRINEIIEGVGKTFNVKVEYNNLFKPIPPVYNNPKMTEEIVGYMQDIDGLKMMKNNGVTGSEDFAFISERVPSVFFNLGAKVEGNEFINHSPFVLFNEDAMPYGAAIFVNAAIKWLKNN